MNDISDKLTPRPAGKVESFNGDIIKSQQVLLKKLEKSFSNLLNSPPVTSAREISPVEVNLKMETIDFDRT